MLYNIDMNNNVAKVDFNRDCPLTEQADIIRKISDKLKSKGINAIVVNRRWLERKEDER